MRRCVLFLCFFTVVTFLQAQRFRDRNRPITMRGSVGIPKPLTSRVFRTAFDGLYEGAFSANIRIAGNFFAGAGYQFTLLQNNKDIFRLISPPNLPGFYLSYNTRFNSHAPYINVGVDKFFSKNGYMSYSVKMGLATVKYTNVNPDSSIANQPFVPYTFSSGLIQPEVAVNFLAGTSLAFNFYFNYTSLMVKFDPKAPRFAHFEEISTRVNSRGERKELKNDHVMSWFSFGFGFNILLGRK
jgi:hypothetical protein